MFKRIKEELDKAKQENSVEKSAQYLNDTSKQLEEALQKVSSIIAELGEVSVKTVVEVPPSVKPQIQEQPPAPQPAADVSAEKEQNGIRTVETESPDQYVDFNIYKSLIVYFISNPESLDVFPEDLRQTLIDRIDEIKRK